MVSSESRFRRLSETAQDGILFITPKAGEITDAFFPVKYGGIFPRTSLSGRNSGKSSFFKDSKAVAKPFKYYKVKGMCVTNYPWKLKMGKR